MFVRDANLVPLPQAADLVLRALKDVQIDVVQRYAAADGIGDEPAGHLAVACQHRSQVHLGEFGMRLARVARFGDGFERPQAGADGLPYARRESGDFLADDVGDGGQIRREVRGRYVPALEHDLGPARVVGEQLVVAHAERLFQVLKVVRGVRGAMGESRRAITLPQFGMAIEMRLGDRTCQVAPVRRKQVNRIAHAQSLIVSKKRT